MKLNTTIVLISLFFVAPAYAENHEQEGKEKPTHDKKDHSHAKSDTKKEMKKGVKKDAKGDAKNGSHEKHKTDKNSKDKPVEKKENTAKAKKAQEPAGKQSWWKFWGK